MILFALERLRVSQILVFCFGGRASGNSSCLGYAVFIVVQRVSMHIGCSCSTFLRVPLPVRYHGTFSEPYPHNYCTCTMKVTVDELA